jgi:hypothetical protein
VAGRRRGRLVRAVDDLTRAEVSDVLCKAVATY